MPKQRQVPPLQKMCLKSIGALVVSLVPSIMERISVHTHPVKMISSLHRCIDWLNEVLLINVPFCLYDQMAMEVLTAVEDKIREGYYPQKVISPFLSEINVIVSLTEVVLSSKLKQIDFCRWTYMRCVLYKNLYRLTGLEVANLGYCTDSWRTNISYKYISDGIMALKNLRSLCLCFDCTDSIVQTVAENCPNIQYIDITSSGSVTDRSIRYFFKCSQLKELQLHQTSITTEGLVQILLGMPNLQHIGKCDEFGTVLKLLRRRISDVARFGLTKIQTKHLDMDHLRILVDMFPKIEYVSLFIRDAIDLSILSSLDHLKDLKVLCYTYYATVDYLLEARGNNLTSLHFERVQDLSFNALLDIGQHCPRLKSFILRDCNFVDNDVSRRIGSLRVQPFLNLERLLWVVGCAISPLEFILCHAINLKNLQLGTSTEVTHAFIKNVLDVNPLKQLEELSISCSNDMSIATVKLILSSCINLKILSELECWLGISMEELKNFKDYIDKNNFDLDIRPTIPYY